MLFDHLLTMMHIQVVAIISMGVSCNISLQLFNHWDFGSHRFITSGFNECWIHFWPFWRWSQGSTKGFLYAAGLVVGWWLRFQTKPDCQPFVDWFQQIMRMSGSIYARTASKCRLDNSVVSFRITEEVWYNPRTSNVQEGANYPLVT